MSEKPLTGQILADKNPLAVFFLRNSLYEHSAISFHVKKKKIKELKDADNTSQKHS